MQRFSANAALFSLGCASLLLTLTATTASASQTVNITPSVEYSSSSGVSEAVRSECTLDTRLPKFIQDYARKQGIEVEVGDGTEGRVLQIKFVTIIGPGGGAWSGAKSVTVEGKLTENGKVIGTFVGSRYSGGGMFGGYKGTCSILGRCIKTLGNDIAKWLVNPTMDARLGNA